MRVLSIPRLLAWALAFALPASIVTHESFQPIDERVHLRDTQAAHAFNLAAREPLFLEYILILRAPADAGRPAAIITVNGAPAATIPGDTLYAPMRGKILLPVDPLRVGDNRLAVRINGPASATIDLQARLQNYYGIAPDFPRVFIVGDAYVNHVAAQRPAVWRAFRFGAYYLASVFLILACSRVTGSRPGGAFVLATGSVILWIALVYGLLTPLHIWLSVEAALVAIAVGWTVGAIALWLVRRRAGVVRWAGATILSLALLEVALRLFNAASPSWVFYSDGYNRYRGQPGAQFFDTRLNTRGFNDIEHTSAKPPNVTRRIVAIGDSFAVGVVPYRANYLTLLESAVAGDGSAEVVNMGVSATDPSDYLDILVQEGLAYQPDAVIVGFFVGNDFEAHRKKPHEYSYVATLINALWRLRRAGGRAAATIDGPVVAYRDDEPGLGRDRFLEIEVDRAWVYDTSDADLRREATRVARHLHDMRDISARAGADFAVVLIPDEAQVDRALQDEVARASGRRDRLDFDLPNRVLTAELSASGIRVLDLLPVFRSEGKATRLYKPQDTHWNLAGNRVAADAIATFLKTGR